MSEQLNQSVAARLEALLARVDGIRLARDIGRPTRFNQRGEAHARQVAAREAAGHPGGQVLPRAGETLGFPTSNVAPM